MSKTAIKRISKRIETVLNKEFGGKETTGRRVLYVVVPGRGLHRRHVTKRAKQFLSYINRQKAVTAEGLQKALKVNRNVVAGAIFELRRAGLVRSERIDA